MKMTILTKLTRLALTLLVAVSLTGCAGYQLGSMLPDDIKTVAVPTFINKTKEPLLEVDCTQAAIEEFQRDGSLKVVSEDQADAVLEVVLIEFTQAPLAYEKTRRTAAQEYRMTIYAGMVLKRKSDGSIISQYPRVRGEAAFELIGDLSSSKLRVLPVAAEDLAHQIVERVVEAW